jgi:hypothetical protein
MTTEKCPLCDLNQIEEGCELMTIQKGEGSEKISCCCHVAFIKTQGKSE